MGKKFNPPRGNFDKENLILDFLRKHPTIGLPLVEPAVVVWDSNQKTFLLIDTSGNSREVPIPDTKLINVISHALFEKFGKEVKITAEKMHEAAKGGYIFKPCAGKESPFPMATSKQVPVEAIMRPLHIPMKFF